MPGAFPGILREAKSNSGGSINIQKPRINAWFLNNSVILKHDVLSFL